MQGTASKETKERKQNNGSERQPASKAGARHGEQENKEKKTKQSER